MTRHPVTGTGVTTPPVGVGRNNVGVPRGPAALYLLVFNDPDEPVTHYRPGWTLLAWQGSAQCWAAALTVDGVSAHTSPREAKAAAEEVLRSYGIAVSGWRDGPPSRTPMFRPLPAPLLPAGPSEPGPRTTAERPQPADTAARSHAHGLLTAAVRSALSALGDRDDAAGTPPGPPDPERVERYLAAALRYATTPTDTSRSTAAAIRSACAHLRAHELTEAYLALHAAQHVLSRPRTAPR